MPPDAIKFKLAAYTDFAALPPIPRDFGHEEADPPIEFGMLGNNRYGCCVPCGQAHASQIHNWMAGRRLTYRTQDVLNDFQAITGVPPSADVGADMQQAASYWQHVGMLGADGKRHKIAAYLEIPTDLRSLYAAMYLFGAVGVGIYNFPTAAFSQFSNRRAWAITGGSRVNSGHFVPCVALRSNIVCVTWGRFQAMRPSFYAAYCKEAVAYISQEALTAGKSPEGFDYQALLADLRALRG